TAGLAAGYADGKVPASADAAVEGETGMREAVAAKVAPTIRFGISLLVVSGIFLVIFILQISPDHAVTPWTRPVDFGTDRADVVVAITTDVAVLVQRGLGEFVIATVAY
ncbi:hypothetical protein V493_05142, partial [Pseudogymnoascus sp. VKM F-4281 (FW-2241)]